VPPTAPVVEVKGWPEVLLVFIVRLFFQMRSMF